MILGVEGSPRTGGNSHRLHKTIFSGEAESRDDCENAHLRDFLSNRAWGARTADATGVVRDSAAA